MGPANNSFPYFVVFLPFLSQLKNPATSKKFFPLTPKLVFLQNVLKRRSLEPELNLISRRKSLERFQPGVLVSINSDSSDQIANLASMIFV